MNVPGWLTLNGFVLLIDVMLLSFSLGKRIRTVQDKAFGRLLLMVLFLIIADSISRLDQAPIGPWPMAPHWLAQIGTYLIFAGDPFGYLFTLGYIDSWITPTDSGSKTRLRTIFIRAFEIYAAFNLVLVTASELTGAGWFYSFPGGVYTRGPLYVPRGIMNMVLCLVVGLYVLLRRQDIRASYQGYIMAFPLIVLFAGSMQVFVGGAAYEYAGTIFACLLLYLYVQDHNMDVDHLTGLLNRRGIDRELMARKVQVEDGRDYAFAACMIDLDYFKGINDTFGHEVGDDALKVMSGLLTRAFTDKYQIGRYGGDEFLVLSDNIVPTTTGVRICRDAMARHVDTLQHLCDEENASGGHPFTLEFSAGFDVYDPSEERMSVNAFVAHIDELMYAEKEACHATRESETRE